MAILYYVSVSGTEISNVIIFLDLSLSLRNPFYPRENRLKYYYGIMVFYIFVSCIYVYDGSINRYIIHQENPFKNSLFNFYHIIWRFKTIACYLLIFVLFIDAVLHLIKLNTSHDLRRLVFFQYALYWLMYFAIMTRTVRF